MQMFGSGCAYCNFSLRMFSLQSVTRCATGCSDNLSRCSAWWNGCKKHHWRTAGLAQWRRAPGKLQKDENQNKVLPAKTFFLHVSVETVHSLLSRCNACFKNEKWYQRKILTEITQWCVVKKKIIICLSYQYNQFESNKNMMCFLLGRTVVIGDHVGDVNFSVCRFGPQAAARGALICVPLILILVGDIIYYKGLILRVHW